MTGTFLAFDTTGASCAVALSREGRVVAQRFEAMTRGQSERLIPLIESVMQEAGVDYDQLSGLAVTTGPGGFTGVRIGVAAARGLALALDIPAVGVSAFEVWAHFILSQEDRQKKSGARLLVALESQRDDLFTQFFDLEARPLEVPVLRHPADLAQKLADQDTFVAGTACDQFESRVVHPLSVSKVGLSGGMIATYVQEQALFTQKIGVPEPLYLRPPDVSLPLKKQHEPVQS